MYGIRNNNNIKRAADWLIGQFIKRNLNDKRFECIFIYLFFFYSFQSSNFEYMVRQIEKKERKKIEWQCACVHFNLLSHFVLSSQQCWLNTASLNEKFVIFCRFTPLKCIFYIIFFSSLFVPLFSFYHHSWVQSFEWIMEKAKRLHIESCTIKSMCQMEKQNKQKFRRE